MYQYITYNKNTGEVMGTFESSAKDARENHPTMDTYFCAICNKEWSKEGIEKMDIIFDISDDEEFDYVVDNLDKKPPFECPKCSGVLELQSNYGTREITAQKMQQISNKKVRFVKSANGKMEVIRPIAKIKL